MWTKSTRSRQGWEKTRFFSSKTYWLDCFCRGVLFCLKNIFLNLKLHFLNINICMKAQNICAYSIFMMIAYMKIFTNLRTKNATSRIFFVSHNCCDFRPLPLVFVVVSRPTLTQGNLFDDGAGGEV